MMRNIRAIVLAVLMVVSVAAPAMAATETVDTLDVSVAQDEDVTVTVTNGTANGAVENASVNVMTVTENVTYDGADEYETGADGTVTLPTPNETVTVSIEATKDNASAATEATLEPAGNERMPFGLQVTNFIAGLNETEDPRGLAIASWVVANNPGNGSGPPAHAGPGNKTQGPPDHAGPDNETRGPPDDAGNESENKTQGPPDHAGNETQGPPDDAGNETQGPPDDAGDDSDDGDDDAGNETQGPPDDAGDDSDDGDDDAGNETQGPPDDAGDDSDDGDDDGDDTGTENDADAKEQ